MKVIVVKYLQVIQQSKINSALSFTLRSDAKEYFCIALIPLQLFQQVRCQITRVFFTETFVVFLFFYTFHNDVDHLVTVRINLIGVFFFNVGLNSTQYPNSAVEIPCWHEINIKYIIWYTKQAPTALPLPQSGIIDLLAVVILITFWLFSDECRKTAAQIKSKEPNTVRKRLKKYL